MRPYHYTFRTKHGYRMLKDYPSVVALRSSVPGG